MMDVRSFIEINPEVVQELDGWTLYWAVTDGSMSFADDTRNILITIAENWTEFNSLLPTAPHPIVHECLGTIFMELHEWLLCFRLAQIHKIKNTYKTFPNGKEEVRSFFTQYSTSA